MPGRTEILKRSPKAQESSAAGAAAAATGPRHRLDCLLRPSSIAVVGASVREASVGSQTLRNLLAAGYPGRLHAVNPRYREVCGVPCHPRLADLPAPAEHVIFAISDERIEQAVEEAAQHGARAVTIMSALVLADDGDPPLRARIACRLAAAGIVACGGNGMGFYNVRDRVWACGFATRQHRPPGNVTLISQSGAGMCGILDVEERIDFNLAVSTGHELNVTLDQYLDWALDQPETRAVGLFIEAVRNPEGFAAALAKAAGRGVPIAAIKVGRTDLSARLAISHCGAMTGRDASFDALFDRYGVQRVRDMDELATALILLAQPYPVGPGGLVTLHDSGGERQLLIDLATEAGVPLTELEPGTAERLQDLLDPGLPAVNPLDGWSAGGPDAEQVMIDCFSTLLSDPGAAIGAVVHDRVAPGGIHAGYLDYLREAHAATGKPVCLVSNHQGTGADPLVTAATREGFPVLDGIGPFLRGVRCLFDYRAFQAQPAMDPPRIPQEVIDRWRARLPAGGMLEEAEALALLRDFGIPCIDMRPVHSLEEVLAAARAVGYPVVLKTAAPGIAHKSEVGGVKLNLANETDLARAWRELARRLGPRALVAPMVREPGVEMILGLAVDEQFGPVVAMGFGGMHAETLRDVVHALPPFDAACARRSIERLRLRPLLDGQRGVPPADVQAYCEAAACFSCLAAALGGHIAELDVNPILAGAGGCLALDALVITRCD